MAVRNPYQNKQGRSCNRSLAMILGLVMMVAFVTWNFVAAPHEQQSTPVHDKALPGVQGNLRDISNSRRNSMQPPPIKGTGKNVPTADEYDDSRDVVVGLATGYSVNLYQRFVGTLRATGYGGKIMLGVSPDIAGVEKAYLEKMDVQMFPIETDDCHYQVEAKDKDSNYQIRIKCSKDYPKMKLEWARYEMARDWVKECDECTGWVLVCDFRDLFFQDHPFKALGDPRAADLGVTRPDLFIMEETGHETSLWFTASPIKKCYDDDFLVTNPGPMLCSGTTIGNRRGILRYLDALLEEYYRISEIGPQCRPPSTNDQSIHNYMYYKGKFGNDINTAAVVNGHGPVNTVGFMGAKIREETTVDGKRLPFYTPKSESERKPNRWLDEKWNLINDDGLFINNDGSVSPIVHQYDRFGRRYDDWLSKWIKKRAPLSAVGLDG